ncbi:EPIDERMAL PATTERNING FACTOR protein 9 [Spatholobus suberectus]|nr:EPIDERMAL PATTERNING FACTOR protein 9 [Spatholobus suberectus]
MSSILYLLIMLLCLTADFASLSLTVINSPQPRYLSPLPSFFIFPQTHVYPLNIFTINTRIPFKVITTQKGRMGDTKLPEVLLLLFTLILAAKVTQGIRTEELVSQSSQPQREPSLEDGNEAWKMRNSRRLMIGSTAPTCTYNECRGCKYKCRAEQVPVEGNDPINSPYHYRCVCHR